MYLHLVGFLAAAELREVDKQGKVVWKYSKGLRGPVHAARLKNGHTLITDFSAGRVLQVDPKGRVIWERKGLKHPYTGMRLEKPAGALKKTRGEKRAPGK